MLFSKDNDLVYYDNKSILERNKVSLVFNSYINIMVKGNIYAIKFDINSLFISPLKNVSGYNKGIYNNKDTFCKKYAVFGINIDKAYIKHLK